MRELNIAKNIVVTQDPEINPATKMTVTVSEVTGASMPAYVIKKQLVGGYSNFVGIATPTEMEDMGLAPTTVSSYWRDYTFELIDNDPATLENIFTDVCLQIQKLMENLDALDAAGTTVNYNITPTTLTII